ncbi:GNAT family N-acetyltransferase [Chitinophaga nivalis]|uniref:GNAT family N-acetyltransferase n=1 Tax=Chitinophaga nivalis TaxID=2991709 RepID=A0ABT3IM64_9BACT|nr:GNAT family N-acetyltransferase [Chitinophaga nivalis]MCW3465252.1 GNAT family N-acetyltransferase [Chitinophaga nivalis]MCW3485056.1 GNAT family N-acetyltransferase [Chitinophaga nivalis]
MIYREATLADIPGLFRVRLAVKENRLVNTSLVTEADYIRYLTTDGKGWVAATMHAIIGFAIIDTHRNNIWALFVDPAFEGQGVGKTLQTAMLHWHFTRSAAPLWLGTGKGTRAEKFYTLTGWKPCGILETGEQKFEITYDAWQNRQC